MKLLLLVMELVALIVVFFGMIFSIVYLGYYMFGFLPYIKGRKLTDEEKKAIIKDGLSHKTTEKGKTGILAQRTILGKSGRTAYSNRFRKTAYLFANAYKKGKGEKFNFNFKYTHEIFIRNITQEQLDSLMIRDYDKAIVCPGNFVFDDTNIIEVVDCGQTYKWYKKVWIIICSLVTMKLDRYVCGLIICTLVAFVILTPIYGYLIYLMM